MTKFNSRLPEARALTEDEVEYIASAIPSDRFPTREEVESVRALRTRIGVFGVDREQTPLFAEVFTSALDVTRARYLSEMRNHVREQARAVRIIPTEIENLREKVRVMCERSAVSPGDTVGFLAAESMGGPIQQMALNSFHSSGSSKNVSGGVGGIKRLINLSKEIPNPIDTVYFYKPLSFVEAIRKEAEFVGVTISMLCDGDVGDIMHVDTLVRPWWYDLYEATEGPIQPHNSWFLRISMNTVMLYQHNVLMRDVVGALSRLDIVQCVYSPTNIGIVDVYTRRDGIEMLTAPAPEKKAPAARDEEVLEDEEAEASLDIIRKIVENPDDADRDGANEKQHEDSLNTAAMTFLHDVVLEFVRKRPIKGIPGISATTPVARPVWAIVGSEEKTGDGVWTIYINRHRSRMRGIGAEAILKLLEVSEIPVVEVGENFIVARSSERPGKIVNERIGAEKKRYQEALTDLKRSSEAREGTTIPRESFKILDAADQFTIETAGTNLLEILKRHDVDYTRTYTNNVYAIAKIFGIGAARVFLIGELQRTIEGAGQYVQPRHILLMVDFMTTRGVPLSVSYNALSKRNINTIALATNQRGMEVLKNAASVGKREAIRGPSAQIMTNRRGNYGTGHMVIIPDYEKMEERERELNEIDRVDRERREAEKRARRESGVIDVEEVMNAIGFSEPGGEEIEEMYDADMIFGAGPAPKPSYEALEGIPSTGTDLPAAPIIEIADAPSVPAEEPTLAVLVDPKIVKFATDNRVVPISVGESGPKSAPTKKRKLPSLGGVSLAKGMNIGQILAEKPTDVATTMQMQSEFITR